MRTVGWETRSRDSRDLPDEAEEVTRALHELDVEVRHLPLAGGDGVTGDFVVVRSTGDGRHVVVIGDVMGSGQRAGGIADRATRLIGDALDAGRDGRQALARLGEWVDAELSDVMVTAMAVTLDRTGAVEVVSSGHPPALLAANGSSAFVDVDLDPPFGSGVEPALVPIREQLPPGGFVLLYTDGLVERRGASFQDGLDRLAATALGCNGDVRVVADHVLEGMGCAAGADDDIALVVLRPQHSDE